MVSESPTPRSRGRAFDGLGLIAVVRPRDIHDTQCAPNPIRGFRYGQAPLRNPKWGGMRLLAVFEAKGLLVLLAGLGLLSLLHRDVDSLAEELVASRLLIHHVWLSGVLLRVAGSVTQGKLWTLASIALAYSLLRFVEAYGLSFRREWGQWLALLSGILYLPWEIRAVFHRPTAVHFELSSLNTAVISYLAWMQHKKSRLRPYQVHT